MNPAFREELTALLPDTIPYTWFAEREAAWMLSRRMGGRARLRDLRRGPLAPLLTRPGVAETAAACGDGWLCPDRLAPLADPNNPDTWGTEDGAMRTAFGAAAAANWLDLSVSLAGWAEAVSGQDWRNLQLSRRGGNLVLQLNFPEAYEREVAMCLGPNARSRIDYYGHPVRREGPITLAWARLDLDRWSEEILIEEVQTDWLRDLRRHSLETWDRPHGKRSDRVPLVQKTLDTYGRIWARALMLAVLIFGRRELGVRRFWMHQPHTGARLKNICEVLPPRSLYTDLPRRFGFRPTDRAPQMLYRARPQALARLRRSGRPLFWHLDLEAAN